ncbi:MAG TPA: crossover junction endodeoxyribonuclease RuvC [Planctomycetota bacterium]|nr:crossover junction endodeoxyribonuclease RuvC [Planctomycetota bacterium]
MRSLAATGAVARDRDEQATAQGASATVILGIDPGTRIVGWGAIVLTPRGPRLVAAGVIRAGTGDLPQRLGLIRRELDRLIELHRPTVVAVEEAFAHKNMQSALRIGEARGVVLSCASAVGVAVHQYPPAAAKKALVGNGAAHKTQVAAMVARRLELAEAPEPLDASDALALALTHVLRSMPQQRHG